MKFKCDPKDLSRALEITSKAVSEKYKIAGYDGIRLKTFEKQIIVTAANPEIYIEQRINADIFIDGEVFIQSLEFKNLLSQLKDKDVIEVEKVGNEIKIIYGHSVGSYACYKNESLPETDLTREGQVLTMKEGDFKDAVEKTAFCVSSEDNRKALKGLFLDIKDNRITMVAIDGARVAIAKKPVVTDIESASLLVPGKLMDDIIKTMDRTSNEPIKLTITKNYLLIQKESTSILINLIDEKYLDYAKFTMNKPETIAVVDKKKLITVLNRVFTVSQKAFQNYISIEAKDEMFKIQSKSADSTIEDYVEVKLEGKELLIGFNSRYLKESVDRINEDYFNIEFNGPMSPISIKPISGDEYVYVLMPLKTMKQN